VPALSLKWHVLYVFIMLTVILTAVTCIGIKICRVLFGILCRYPQIYPPNLLYCLKIFAVSVRMVIVCEFRSQKMSPLCLSTGKFVT